ncbi:hypothetical protein Csa_000694 [Cucumis sativus]|nr:hypothetical protein Csa_000694 [Cucumis sativus]
MAEVYKVSLKLVIDKKRKRVLYGEADKEFIDFLFTILALPVGTVIKLQSTEPMLPGPLSNLYCSMDSLNTINYFEPKRRLQNLLNPKTYYLCNNNYRKQSSCHSVSSTHGTKCPNCGGYMTINLAYVYVDEEEKLIEGGYVTGMGKYMVMDDLTVKPMAYSSMSTISVLNELNVDDISQIEDKLIRLDIKEIGGDKGSKAVSISM